MPGSWDPRLLQYPSFGYGPLHPVEHLSGTMTLPRMTTPSENPYLSPNMDSTPSPLHPSQIDTSTPSCNPSKFNVAPGTPSPTPPSSFSTLAKVQSSPILPEATHHESIVTITNQQTEISDELIITTDHTAIERPVETIDAHVKTPELLAEVEITDDLEPNGTETVVENHGEEDKGTEAVLPQGPEDDNIGDTGSFVVDHDSQTQRVDISETESSSGEEDVDTSDSKDCV